MPNTQQHLIVNWPTLFNMTVHDGLSSVRPNYSIYDPQALCCRRDALNVQLVHIHIGYSGKKMSRLVWKLPSPYMMSTEEKKSPQRPITEETKLKVFDHLIHQKLATDVIGVSFDAQWYEVFGYRHGESVGCVIPELRGLGWSST